MSEDASKELLDQEVVGMEKLVAIVKIENAGCRARIMAEDGEHFAGTMDFGPDRLNLEIVSGKVVSVYRG
jgi:hypothetical protein